jgi:hypothetical protein
LNLKLDYPDHFVDIVVGIDVIVVLIIVDFLFALLFLFVLVNVLANVFVVSLDLVLLLTRLQRPARTTRQSSHDTITGHEMLACLSVVLLR